MGSHDATDGHHVDGVACADTAEDSMEARQPEVQKQNFVLKLRNKKSKIINQIINCSTWREFLIERVKHLDEQQQHLEGASSIVDFQQVRIPCNSI